MATTIIANPDLSGSIPHTGLEHDYPDKPLSFPTVGTGLVPVLFLCLFMESRIAKCRLVGTRDGESPSFLF
ncbi:hypothetical protein [Chlorobaculum sp. 24CR]|uniref:hypothetical protein n=1 Tax=Chlorobaculum sp. 24CR TaxID=2508878 RepID=UPI00142FD05E|nr:hypothetical protein [Chlorobaculum sp. 24CR]